MTKHRYVAGTILKESTDDGLFIVEILGTDIAIENYRYKVLLSPTTPTEGLIDSFPIQILDESTIIEVVSKNWKLLYGRP